MKRIISSLGIMVALFGIGLVAVPASTASAINVFNQCTPVNPSDPNDPSNTSVCKAQGTDNATSMVTIVINTMLFILGSIAVIMIIIGGIRYTTSNGESAGIKGAKDTITYAVVGLVVAILAYSIVNFVIGKF